jgi:hypothetical protein
MKVRFFGERVNVELSYGYTAAVVYCNTDDEKLLALYQEGLVRRSHECTQEDLEDAIRVVSKTGHYWLKRMLMELV